MTSDRLRDVGVALMIGIAIFPIVLLAVWGLTWLGVFAAGMEMPADNSPLVYGLVFAVLTITLVDLLGVASVVLALISSANLIEYAQLVIPGTTASPIDFVASLAGVIVAALLVWMAQSLVERSNMDQSGSQ